MAQDKKVQHKIAQPFIEVLDELVLVDSKINI